MKYATRLLGLAILMTSITAAAAKVDRACLREIRKLGISTAQAKRICDPKYDAKPHEWGWVCESPGSGTLSRVKGQGARLKRDVLCE
jgi:hypothetical protein